MTKHGHHRKPISKTAQPRVSAKISHLVKKEGVKQSQAVATALNMQRKGRLGPKGGYRRASSKKG